MINCYKFILFVLLSSFTLNTLAWTDSLEFGYGASQDPNNSKATNSGMVLSSDFLPLYQSLHWRFNLNATLSKWYTTTAVYKHLTTAAFSIAGRVYPFNDPCAKPYFIVTVGPSYLSSKQFGYNRQAGNLSFQSTAGLGMEFLHNHRGLDLNLRAFHYSNAYIKNPNQGYNILYVLSVGYLF